MDADNGMRFVAGHQPPFDPNTMAQNIETMQATIASLCLKLDAVQVELQQTTATLAAQDDTLDHRLSYLEGKVEVIDAYLKDKDA